VLAEVPELPLVSCARTGSASPIPRTIAGTIVNILFLLLII
jgi:hypothetical protein